MLCCGLQVLVSSTTRTQNQAGTLWVEVLSTEGDGLAPMTLPAILDEECVFGSKKIKKLAHSSTPWHPAQKG